MTKVIAALIIAAVLYGGWQLFFYWEKVRDEKEAAQKQQTSALTEGSSLPGMPSSQLEQTLQAAERNGVAGVREWLKVYGPSVKDPRKAWIELDYCGMLVRENPAEARRIFKSVKDRTPATSPVYDRIKKLEKSYE